VGDTRGATVVLRRMIRYGEHASTCRRVTLCEGLGEAAAARRVTCGLACDVCAGAARGARTPAGARARELLDALRAAAAAGTRLTV